jgi:hypothetical protein
MELKWLYRVTCLEGNLSQPDSELDCREDATRVTLKGRPGKENRDEDAEKQKWKKLISDHKLCVIFEFCLYPVPTTPLRLAEMIQSSRNLSQLLCSSFLTRHPYEIQYYYQTLYPRLHKLLETLRRASFGGSPLALEHLPEFIYYAYTFYHHIELLCREVEGEELRGIYHFIKRCAGCHWWNTCPGVNSVFGLA